MYGGQLTDCLHKYQPAPNLSKLWRNVTPEAILPGSLGSVTIKRLLWELV